MVLVGRIGWLFILGALRTTTGGPLYRCYLDSIYLPIYGKSYRPFVSLPIPFFFTPMTVTETHCFIHRQGEINIAS